MKRFWTALLSVSFLIAPVALLPLVSGCAMFSGANGQRFSTGAKLALMIGVSEYIRAHPETRPAFVTARDALVVLSTSENIDAAMLVAVLGKLPVKQFESDRAKLFIAAGTIILTDAAGELPVDRLKELQPIAKDISDGITLGLGTP